jgi:hypothetical protein
MKEGICSCEQDALCRFVCGQYRTLYAHARGPNHPNRSICVSAIKSSQLIQSTGKYSAKIPQVGGQADLCLLGALHSGEANEHLAR